MVRSFALICLVPSLLLLSCVASRGRLICTACSLFCAAGMQDAAHHSPSEGSLVVALPLQLRRVLAQDPGEYFPGMSSVEVARALQMLVVQVISGHRWRI